MKTLIADDDATTRRMLRIVLVRWGYDVIEARDGNEAWDHFQGSDPARLAIVDWIMPGLSGLDLCRRLKGRERKPGPYVILLTARSHWKDVVHGLESGADDYVAKPYQLEELRARVAVGRRLVELQEELLMLNDKLERRVMERTERIRTLLEQDKELILQLGHDLRTPLTPLMALLPGLVADEMDPDRKESLSLCLAQAQYLKRLATRVFDLGRLESPRTSLRVRPIPLLPLVTAATERLAGEDPVKANGHRVAIDVEPTLDVYGDGVWLERVFEDLLDNAFRFSPPGTPVAVTAQSLDRDVVVAVTDQGKGLVSEQLERVFDPFYTGDLARTDRNTSGLGLAICRRVVERHGGRIWADSPGLGKGTTIRFTLSRAGNGLEIQGEGERP